jgi:hypothetical protein
MYRTSAALYLGSILLFLASATGRASESSALEILKQSDAARGGGLPGVTWNVRATAVDGARLREQELVVKADADNSLVEFVSPPKVKGQKMLMVNENMWFIKPGLRKPVPISARQRLLGQAANGDVAATDYAGDYEPTLLGEERVDGEPCYILELVASSTAVTYDRIHYWVSKSRRVGVKAEFFTVSGKLFKSARFDYGNRIEYEGRSIPFVSKMVIRDEIDPSQVTTLEYSGILGVSLPPRTFSLSYLRS